MQWNPGVPSIEWTGWMGWCDEDLVRRFKISSSSRWHRWYEKGFMLLTWWWMPIVLLSSEAIPPSSQSAMLVDKEVWITLFINLSRPSSTTTLLLLSSVDSFPFINVLLSVMMPSYEVSTVPSLIILVLQWWKPWNSPQTHHILILYCFVFLSVE